jgi:hypothetical protein
MIDLKTFTEQVHKMRIAQQRKEDLRIQMNTHAIIDQKAITDSVQITANLEADVDRAISDIHKQQRITPEQINADAQLNAALENSLKEWNKELEDVQRETVDQALIDAKEGHPSNRYKMLEKREGELKRDIILAEQKLGIVRERVAANPALAGMIGKTLESVRP